MRASRLMTIMMLLQAQRRVTSADLAAALEVSVRTIHRDIEQLSAAGVPVYAERGRFGGFRLIDGWRTDLTGLTETEAQAVFLTGLPGPAAELGLGEALAAAELKLAVALPAGWQDDARRISTRVHLDTVGWYRPSVPAEHLATVSAAVWNDEILRVSYESWTGTTERELWPLGLVVKAGTWYMVASGAAQEARTFRLSNVRAATPTGHHFVRPPSFDLAAHWTSSTREFEDRLYVSEAVVLVSDRGRAALLRSTAAVSAAAGRAVDEGDGRHRVALPIESIGHAAEQLIALGAEVEVLGPPELRSALAAIAQQIVDTYAPVLSAAVNATSARARGGRADPADS